MTGEDQKTTNTILTRELDRTFKVLEREVNDFDPELRVEETGRINTLGHGIAMISGIPGAEAEELLLFPGNLYGMAFDLTEDLVGALLLDETESLEAGFEVRRTGRVLDVPVGDLLLGRVVDALGRSLDGGPELGSLERMPVERMAPTIMQRAPVSEPLETGIKVVDALVPIGKGQRELIVGDRQTGKTSIALDAIVNQKDKDVICIYCAIGERSSAVAGVVADFKKCGAMDYSIVVAASGEDAPGLQYIAPYSATTIAEYFMKNGKDVLVVYDDLTRHARAYRELSLLLRRPPGREAFPGDIFYIHSRLLERATSLREEYGGGSLTALPIVETEAQNISGYIPTNVISITDGQIYLSPILFRKGIFPAVDVGKSVSRVGGKAQLAAYSSVAGNLRLSYSQFEELETFARFGTRIGDETKALLDRGMRVREVLKQGRYSPLSASEQIALLCALDDGVLDPVELKMIGSAGKIVVERVSSLAGDLLGRITEGQKLTSEDRARLVKIAAEAVENLDLAA